MEIIGKTTQTAVCMHCDGELAYIEWQGAESAWEHTAPSEHGGGMQGMYCPGSPVAEPVPDSIEREESGGGMKASFE